MSTAYEIFDGASRVCAAKFLRYVLDIIVSEIMCRLKGVRGCADDVRGDDFRQIPVVNVKQRTVSIIECPHPFVLCL